MTKDVEHFGWWKTHLSCESAQLFRFEFALGPQNPRPALAVSDNYHEISATGRYAVYNGALLKLRAEIAPILLVSDIDNTLFNSNETACAAARRFLKYWLKTHQFNGSKLVLNT
jgi:hypothetical protein